MAWYAWGTAIPQSPSEVGKTGVMPQGRGEIAHPRGDARRAPRVRGGRNGGSGRGPPFEHEPRDVGPQHRLGRALVDVLPAGTGASHEGEPQRRGGQADGQVRSTHVMPAYGYIAPQGNLTRPDITADGRDFFKGNN